MEKTDLTKPVVTRDGRKARVICTDRKCEVAYPVIALVDNGGAEDPYRYAEDGRFLMNERHELDLVNVPEKKTVVKYFNCYPGGRLAIHDSAATAEGLSMPDREACIKLPITYTVGQFDA